jgi:DNA ligase-1
MSLIITAILPRCLRLSIFLFALLPFTLSTPLYAGKPPGLLLANVYQNPVQLSDYWVSEKLDGVRAYWDGKHLISRQGNRFNAPTWFTAGFPDVPLDGELWGGRGTFEQVSGTVRQLTPTDDDWKHVRYMVFDLPVAELTFNQRLVNLTNVLNERAIPHLQVVAQFKVKDQSALTAELERVMEEGGEGLMLHRGESFYHASRSDDLLKLKTYDDAEARVIAHLPGKGKYTGMMGALSVETPDGRRFKIGTGFTDAVRADPPPIGTWVTYKYFGLTNKNIPRFASFLRVRYDFDQLPNAQSAE